MPDPVTATVSAVKAGSGIMQAKGQKKAAKKAAAAQEAAEREALALQREMFERQVGLQEPFRQAGILSQNELLRQMGLSGEPTSAGYGGLMQTFGQQQFEQDPGYAFRLQEGLKALDRQAARRGGLISGSALKEAQRYGQGMASQEYQNAYNRFVQDRQARYNMLMGQQNVGASAVNALGGAAQNYAGVGGQNIVGAGQARASQYAPVAAARNQLIGGLSNIGSQLAEGYGNLGGAQRISSGWTNWQDPTQFMNNQVYAPTMPVGGG